MRSGNTLAIAFTSLLIMGGGAMAQSTYHNRSVYDDHSMSSDWNWNGPATSRSYSAGGYGGVYAYAPDTYAPDAYAYAPDGAFGAYVGIAPRGSVGVPEPGSVFTDGTVGKGPNDPSGTAVGSSSQTDYNPALDRAKGSF
jgi:hypothetical protein